MDASNLASFALVATLLVVSPGPNGALLAKTVPTSGRAAGFANVAGFVAAFQLHGVLSILGISAILVRSAEAFLVVKLLGAAYLCWIGVKALREAIAPAPPVAAVPTASGTSGTSGRGRARGPAVAFAEGFATNALNPKVSMFYLAAFPQFIAPGDSPWSAFALVELHTLINAAWFVLMVVAFGRLSRLARNGGAQRWIKGVTGAVFIGFGTRLATFRP